MHHPYIQQQQALQGETFILPSALVHQKYAYNHEAISNTGNWTDTVHGTRAAMLDPPRQHRQAGISTNAELTSC